MVPNFLVNQSVDTMIPALVNLAVAAGSWLVSKLLTSGDNGPNPTYAAIESRQRAEAERDRAIHELNNTNAQMAQLMRSTQEMQRKFIEYQEASMSAAAAAQEKTQEQVKRAMEAENAANVARLAAENAARVATEDARKNAEEAEGERQRAWAVMEKARRAADAIKVDAERLERAEGKAKKRADEAIAKAEAAKEAARNRVGEATAAKEDAEKRLREGIQPVMTPTAEEILAAQRKIEYEEKLFHFAIVGKAGVGKSSLVNAVRGMSNGERGSARTGVSETTMRLGRYRDREEGCNHVWYDVAGAGTMNVPDWQYFNAEGLYVFDCIILLFDSRFTESDVAILLNCRRFKIPTYIVRSKADQHVRNMMKEMGYDSDDEEVELEGKGKGKGKGKSRPALYMGAREQFVEETRCSVKGNLAEANLPDQKVYVVSSGCLRAVAKGKKPQGVIDEVQLLNDLYVEAQARRGGDVGVGVVNRR